MMTACQRGLWEELPEPDSEITRWHGPGAQRHLGWKVGVMGLHPGTWVISAPGRDFWSLGFHLRPRPGFREEMRTSFPMSDSHLLPLSGSQYHTLLSLIKAFCTNYRSQSCPLRWLAWNRDLSGCQRSSRQRAFMHNLIWTWQTFL